jgi:hypothetical protein
MREKRKIAPSKKRPYLNGLLALFEISGIVAVTLVVRSAEEKF